MQAVEGAEDEIGQELLLMRRHCVDVKSDVLIAVAASGTTPFTSACMRPADTRVPLCIANNPHTPALGA